MKDHVRLMMKIFKKQRRNYENAGISRSREALLKRQGRKQ